MIEQRKELRILRYGWTPAASARPVRSGLSILSRGRAKLLGVLLACSGSVWAASEGRGAVSEAEAEAIDATAANVTDATATEVIEADTAIAAADQLAASTPSAQPVVPADPYADLKRSVELQEYQPALLEVEAVIAAVERDSHRYDHALAEPLLIRGDIRFGLGDYPGALDDYARSVHVRRVNSGLHHPDQIDAVYREASALKQIGELQAASSREEYAYEVLRNHHGAYSPKILPGLYHLAQWHTRTNNPFAARRLFAQAKLIIESTEDDMSPNLIKPLKGLALTHRMERFPLYYFSRRPENQSTFTAAPEMYRGNEPLTLNNFPSGERALKRIVRILETKAETEPVPLAEAIIDLGDWNMLFEKFNTASQYYQHAELLLAQAHSEASQAVFDKPVMLHFPNPGNPKAPPQALRREPQTGYVTINYSITARGTVANLETVDSFPKGLMDFRVRKSLRAARFRPPMMDGTLTTASDQTFRHEYRYYPSLRDGNGEVPVSAEDSTAPQAEAAGIDG
ncbi:MAG: TonB family protein [Pseudomonadales bacterium]